MLILVAVTITIALKGGLFGYAGKAAQDTETKKREEINWTNLSANMSTDQLISKYTGENPDLAKLRKYYIDGDETAIPNSNETIIEIAPERGWEDENKVISYNNHYYKVFYSYDDEQDKMVTESIVELSDKAGEAYMVLAGGTEICLLDEIRFYNKNNNIYKVIFSGKEPQEAITIGEDETIVAVPRKGVYNNGTTTFVDGGYIQFKPTQGQKWFQWPNNSDTDIIVNIGMTLKQLITNVNDQENKTIQFIYATGGTRQDKRKATLEANGVACTADADIMPNTVYVFISRSD